MRNSIVMILAGGQGSRIYPLSRDRAKPAIPFGGKYRIIDFVLNNLVNSGFYQIYVLIQFKSQSLNKHIEQGWRMSPQLGHFISLVPAQMRTGNTWYRGTADAIYQNFNLFGEDNPFDQLLAGDDKFELIVHNFDPDAIARGIFVGDLPNDVYVSEMLKIPCYGVTWGYSDEGELSTPFIVDEISELIEMVEDHLEDLKGESSEEIEEVEFEEIEFDETDDFELVDE